MPNVALYPQAPDLTIADLCAGTGMLSTGVELALAAMSLRSAVVCYVEREASAAASLVARMEAKAIHPAPVWSDLATFDGAAWRGLVDCVVAGIPCQPWSTAGKRLGVRDARHLGPILCEQIAAIEPGIVFVENVAGYVRVGYRELRSQLGAMGYTVATGLFSSAECGASHQRKRLFVLGVADAIRAELFSQAARRPGRANGIAAAESSRALVDDSSVRWGQDATTECAGQPESTDGQRSMADVQDIGWRQVLREDDGETKVGEALANSSRDLGDSDSQQRRSGQVSEADQAGTGVGAGYRDLPRYAPAQNDFRAWAAVAEVDPARMPAIESEVRRMADGLAPASDQLRLVGNGVDPLVAAYAFLSLAACLRGA